MNIAQIRKVDIANGLGIRCSLFVAGCSHHCKGCFNEAYQDFQYGTPFTYELEQEFVTYAKNENVHGISILGGEPFDQIKDEDLTRLLRRLKKETDKNIWIYSGYTFEQIIEDARKRRILAYCDVLVDGKFVEELKDFKLRFKGSSNQRIIDVQPSLKNGHVIIYNF